MASDFHQAEREAAERLAFSLGPGKSDRALALIASMGLAPDGPCPAWFSFPTDLDDRPYAADVLADGVFREARAVALTRRHIGFTRAHVTIWLFFDVDHADAADSWDRASGQPPNVIIQNPANGHAHLGYRLAVPVGRTATHRFGPIRFLSAIERGMVRRLGADRGYAGFMAKNPLHPHWRTRWLAPMPYKLEALAGDLTQNDMRKAPDDELAGLGRNCTLFEELRQWAYRACRNAKTNGVTFEAFLTETINVAQGINVGFDPPLPFSEVRSNSRSVAKWTWQNFSPTDFHVIQSARGQRSGVVRHAAADARRAALTTAEVHTTAQPPSTPRLSDMVGGRVAVRDHVVSDRTARRDRAAIRGTPSRGAAEPQSIVAFGVTLASTKEAAEIAGVPRKTFADRLAKGFSPEIAILMPRRDGSRPHKREHPKLNLKIVMVKVHSAFEAIHASLPADVITAADVIAWQESQQACDPR